MNPFKKRKNDSSGQLIILDTCALIDGRIIEIAKAGFVPQMVIIPQFIIAELQFLADHGDSHKRERARYGLDVIRELQDLRNVRVSIAREQFKHIDQVDDKLIAIAKQYGGMLYTTDYNLNKVAQIEGVTVLNVNELAQALRPRHLPGERMEIKITQVGQDPTQGVGYLDDGTMVVVEKAGRKVGQKVPVEFSRMLQTQAGKMMFALLQQDRETTTVKTQHKANAHVATVKQAVQQPNASHRHKPNKVQQNQQSDKPANSPKVYHAYPQKRAHVKTSTVQPEPSAPKPNKHHPQPRQSQPRRNKKSTGPEELLLHAIEESQRDRS